MVWLLPSKSHGMFPFRAFARRLVLLAIAAVFLALAAPRPAAAQGLTPVPVAPGVYAFVGALAEPAVENLGFVANQGFIVGDSGVIVIDTGTHHAHAEAMLAAIRRVTDRPVALVINTHAAPERVLGNGVFAARGAPILAHRDAVRYMEANCHTCIRRLADALGGETMAGTSVTLPTRAVDGSVTLEVAGRRLSLLHFGWTLAGDLAVLDQESGALFTGDLVCLDRVPEARDTRLEVWLAALQALRDLPVRVLVPGRGPVSDPRRVADTRAYLEALQQAVRARYEEGDSLREVTARAAVPAFQGWALYARLHAANVHHLYLELENKALAE
ncbi:MAG: Zn-dependent hydrolase glyoxylase [Burkholderiales bacterium]|nr:MAG: Zn-dependent hydrolase glyoxylase [Burkholderiales bacterium]